MKLIGSRVLRALATGAGMALVSLLVDVIFNPNPLNSETIQTKLGTFAIGSVLAYLVFAYFETKAAKKSGS